MLGFGAKAKAKQQFEAQVAPWLDALYAAALRLTRNERDAEDLVQDAVMRAYRFFDSFEQGTNFRAWLFKILTNTFINQYRRSVKERALDSGSEREMVQAQFFSFDATDPASNPEDYLLQRVMSEDVLKAIDTLPVDFRMVVILADLQEFSYREIADILDVPVGTVMSRLFRGRKALHHALVERGHGSDAGAPLELDAYRARKKSGTHGV